jgi:hypothetical protein
MFDANIHLILIRANIYTFYFWFLTDFNIWGLFNYNIIINFI